MIFFSCPIFKSGATQRCSNNEVTTNDFYHHLFIFSGVLQTHNASIPMRVVSSHRLLVLFVSLFLVSHLNKALRSPVVNHPNCDVSLMPLSPPAGKPRDGPGIYDGASCAAQVTTSCREAVIVVATMHCCYLLLLRQLLLLMLLLLLLLLLLMLLMLLAEKYLPRLAPGRCSGSVPSTCEKSMSIRERVASARRLNLGRGVWTLGQRAPLVQLVTKMVEFSFGTHFNRRLEIWSTFSELDWIGNFIYVTVTPLTWRIWGVYLRSTFIVYYLVLERVPVNAEVCICNNNLMADHRFAQHDGNVHSTYSYQK